MAQWITTWTQAHADMSMNCKKNRDHTARITMRSELGGDKIRIRLSNQEGKATMDVEGASVMAEDRPPIAFTFHGSPNLRLAPKKQDCSDPLDIPVSAGTPITISIAFKGVATSGNNLPEETRLSPKGNYTQTVLMPAAGQSLLQKLQSKAAVLPALSAVEIYSEEKRDVLVCFGDSITQMSYWTKPLADMLRYSGSSTILLNKGIAGNQLLSNPMSKIFSAYGTAGYKRFQEDVLHVSGANAVVFALGTNDLTMVKDAAAIKGKSERLFARFTELATQAKNAGMKVYIATVTPNAGCMGNRGFLDPERERLNQLIRESSFFDGVLDFDAAIRDPDDPNRMLESFDSGDHLHPGVIGGRKMAQAACAVLSQKEVG